MKRANLLLAAMIMLGNNPFETVSNENNTVTLTGLVNGETTEATISDKAYGYLTELLEDCVDNDQALAESLNVLAEESNLDAVVEQLEELPTEVAVPTEEEI